MGTRGRLAVFGVCPGFYDGMLGSSLMSASYVSVAAIRSAVFRQRRSASLRSLREKRSEKIPHAGMTMALILTCWESGHGHWVLPSGLDPYNGMLVRQIAGIGVLLPPTTAAY